MLKFQESLKTKILENSVLVCATHCACLLTPLGICFWVTQPKDKVKRPLNKTSAKHYKIPGFQDTDTERSFIVGLWITSG